MVAEFQLPQDSRSLYYRFQEPYYAHGHAHVAPMGKWPWHCTSRGWGSSNGLDFNEVNRPNGCWLMGWTNRWPAGDHSIVPLFSFRKDGGQLPVCCLSIVGTQDRHSLGTSTRPPRWNFPCVEWNTTHCHVCRHTCALGASCSAVRAAFLESIHKATRGHAGRRAGS